MKRMNLLMVDDDPDDQELFSQALKETNVSIQAEFACNGADALRKLEMAVHLPDILFCDINMPVMNGIEFLEEIKKSEKLNSIPVVIYTTSSSAIFRSQCKSLGANYFITKPSSFSKMCEEIKNTFRQVFKSKVLGNNLKTFSPG